MSNLIYVPAYLASGAVDPAAINAKLVAYWQCDEGSGASRLDSIGSSTLLNNGTVGAGSALGVNDAEWASANTANFLNVADNAALSMGNFDWGMFGWFIADSFSGLGRVLLSKGDDNAAAAETEFIATTEIVSAQNDLVFYMSDHSIRTRLALGVSMSTGATYFWHMSYDAAANLMKIKLNDTITAQTSQSTGCYDGANALTVGRYNNFAGGAWHGKQAGIGLYKGSLTAAEETYLYNAGVPLIGPF